MPEEIMMLRHRDPSFLFALIALILTSATPASAAWVLTLHRVNTTTSFHTASSGWLHQERSTIRAFGGTIHGDALAKSGNWPVEAQVQNVGSGFQYLVWDFVPPGVGEVELVKSAQIWGEAEVAHGPGSAAALGFTVSRHAFDGSWHEIKAQLTRSVAATSERAWANLTLPMGHGSAMGATMSFPLSVTTGKGTFSDDGGGEQIASALQCPVHRFEIDNRSHAVLSCWARSDFWQLLQSRAEAQLRGEARLTALLITLPQCP
jgi:hypothetical protein